MKISRKYPMFLLLTTVVTAGAIFGAMLGVLRTTLEKELTARGESTADFLALANGPLMLEKNYTQLKYNLASLAGDPFIANAVVADHNGMVVASLDRTQIGEMLPTYLKNDKQTRWPDSKRNAYHFRAMMRFDKVELGTFIVSLSRQPLQVALKRVTQWAMLLVGGIAAVIAIFSLLFVRRELRPITAMGKALEIIAKGDFTQRVTVNRDDEFGDLARAFNAMVRRSSLFFHYVDKMVIERLVSDESLVKPGGRERNLAVLFGDMRGYTAMSNRRSADQVVGIVNTYFHLFIECIAHFGGMVDKTMGDAIMSVFEGHDESTEENHREQGVQALAYMKITSRILNAFLAANPDAAERLGLEPREWGFAMATGPAIVGNIGSRRRMDYTVCGRVVNLASRLEGLTKSGEVIVDNFTRMDAPHLFEMEALPPVQPKGFSEAEKVIPHRITSMTPQAIDGMRSFMKRLFSYAFVQDKLMPEDLEERDRHNWCATQQRALEQIIEATPPAYFFARANTETGRVLMEDVRTSEAC